MNRQARRQAQREIDRLVRADVVGRTASPSERQWIADQVMKRLQNGTEKADAPRKDEPIHVFAERK